MWMYTGRGWDKGNENAYSHRFQAACSGIGVKRPTNMQQGVAASNRRVIFREHRLLKTRRTPPVWGASLTRAWRRALQSVAYKRLSVIHGGCR